MWAKFLQTILTPLIKDSVVSLFEWAKNKITEYFRKKELKKENESKVEEYVKADNVDDANDSFDKLP